MNSVSIVGRLARDPELRYTDGGMPVAKFRIAVSRPVKKGPDGNTPADFIPVMAFRKTAEIVAQYAHQGDLVSVVGSIQTRQYQNPTDPNVTRYDWGGVANRVGFLAKKGSGRAAQADTAAATAHDTPPADAAEDADMRPPLTAAWTIPSDPRRASRAERRPGGRAAGRHAHDRRGWTAGAAGVREQRAGVTASDGA